MTVSYALIPVERFLPSRVEFVGQWVDHYYENSNPSRQEALLRIVTPDSGGNTYGPDGEKVITLKTGEFIDIYA